MGTLCGTFMRLALFGFVLLGAFIFAKLLRAVLAVAVLQVGYTAGIILRAAMRPLRSGSQHGATIARKRPVRVPPEQKRR
jgi:hypothetical protein